MDVIGGGYMRLSHCRRIPLCRSVYLLSSTLLGEFRSRLHARAEGGEDTKMTRLRECVTHFPPDWGPFHS
jgi:hypothetical protein